MIGTYDGVRFVHSVDTADQATDPASFELDSTRFLEREVAENALRQWAKRKGIPACLSV